MYLNAAEDTSAAAFFSNMKTTEYYIKHINDPYLNRILAPALNLYRPKINWIRFSSLSVILLTIDAILIGITIFFSSKYSKIEYSTYIAVLTLWSTLIICICAKRYFIFAIMCYQRYAKSSTRLKCCCYPSCSQYAIIALQKYGVIIGSFLAIRHCINCAPPGTREFP